MKPAYFLALAVAAAFVFVLFPGLDIETARLFHVPPKHFPLREWWPVVAIYESVPVIPWLTVAGLIIATLPWLIPALARFRVRRAVIAYVALSLAIGPGLLSNGLLKENWGRARPAQIVEFGGPKAFSAAIVPAKECPANCAFVSGHAAVGFFLVTFALLAAPGTRRRAAVAAAVAAGSIIGLGRMAQGSHWLSDIVFAGFINIAVAWTLHHWLIARDEVSRAAANVMQSTTFRRHVKILLGVIAATVLCIAFVDEPLARWAAKAPSDVHVWFERVANVGESTRWYLIFALCFAALWLGAKLAPGATRELQFKAWSMLPLYLFAATAVAGLAGILLKILFGRARPGVFLNTGDASFHWLSLTAKYMSFPSGHANTITAMMVGLGFIAPRFRLAFLAIAVTVLFARMAEYQHFASDIVFGAWIGFVAAVWMRSVFSRSGIELPDALAGRFTPRGGIGWGERLGLGPHLRHP
jgi:lipid A 4'-phosphatase